MNEPTITYAAQDVIQQYDIIAFNFIKKIFDMNYHEMALSDESFLSDFIGCGLNDDDFNLIADLYEESAYPHIQYVQAEKLYQKIQKDFWSICIKRRVHQLYNIKLTTVDVTLNSIFEKIQHTFKTEVLEQENQNFTFKIENTPPLPSKPLLDIEEALKVTFNHVFYAHHKKISLDEALSIIQERKNTFLTFIPYRP